MTLDKLEGKLKLRLKSKIKDTFPRKVDRVKKKVSAAAMKWKTEARRLLNKPHTGTSNTSLYPRRRSGQLRNSVYYKIRTSVGETKATISIYYGFHEVYSKHSPRYNMFAYGKFLDESGATYGGYRERINNKLAARLDTIVRHYKRT